MDVRLAPLRLAARTDRPDAVALGDRHAPRHGDRAEVGERDRPAVGGLDRHALAVRRDRARERDDARRGRAHHRPRRARHVDAAVLAGRLRVRRVVRERLQDGAVRGPRPGARHRDEDERGDEHEQEPSHGREPRWSSVRERLFATVRDGAAPLANLFTELSQRAAVELVPGHARSAARRPRRRRAAALPRPRARPPRPPASRRRATPRAPGPSTSVISPFDGSANRSASAAAGPRTTSSNRFVSSRQTATSRSGRGRRERAQRRRQPLRRLERDHRPAPRRELGPQRVELAGPPRQEADERVPLRDEPARDERRLDRRRAGQHRHRHARVERRAHEPPARIGDPRQARVRHERDPLPAPRAAARAPRRAPPRCARGTRAAAPRSRAARGGRACAACPRRGRRRRRGARRAPAA